MKAESNTTKPSSYSVMADTTSHRHFNDLGQISDVLTVGSLGPVSGSLGIEKVASRGLHPAPAFPGDQLAIRVRAVLKRLPSTEEMEPFFSRLRGVDLVMATLAYGLGVRVSDLKGIRVRDVNLLTRQIVLDGVVRPLPAMIVDDIRDYLNERLCGSEATVTVARREQRLFSEEDLQGFFRQVSEHQRSLTMQRIQGASGATASAEAAQSVLTERCLNRIFRLLGRFHARGALRKGAKLRSPLDLFDNGPRIVRRGRRGVVDAYYLWRAVYPQCCF